MKKEYLCLDCGNVFTTDSKNPVCPECGSKEIDVQEINQHYYTSIKR